MNEDDDAVNKGSDETFLARWSQRKRAAAVSPKERELDLPTTPQAPEPAVDGCCQSVPTELPPLESLGDDSDYSVFMMQGVDEGLRAQALRRLFSAARFNVRDGLCEYDSDYTQFTPLGDWTIAKLREQRERALQIVQQRLSGEPPRATSAEDAAHEPRGKDDNDPA